jgi:hypothetical protein
MSEEIAYTWQGVWDAGAGGFVEFFGGDDGLPARDLTSADVAAFTDEQNAKLRSDAGKRLYQPVKVSGGRGKAADADAAPA